MSDFAQRLVARSAGRPTGLPLLMPRPASRFDESEAQTLEEVTETAAPVDAGPAEHPVANRRRVSAVQPPLSRRVEPPERAHDTGEARQEKAPITERAAAIAQPSPTIVSQPAEPGDEPHREEAEPAAARPISVTHMIETAPKPGDAPVATAHLAPVIAPADEAKAAPAAPAISIDRIDVQFMAPERPVAIQRSEPQRTRGFEAYARARRGMPR